MRKRVCEPSLPCVEASMADDLCLIANNAKDLQLALNSLEKYCDSNNLVVNINKSKLVVFHKGRLPREEIYYKQSVLERVNEFTYLGITLSSQMSYSSHLQNLVMKANTRIGLLYSRLELQKMPVEVLKKIFGCYILPVFQYGLVLWLTGTFSSTAEQLVNSMFTKFWKRYLNLSQSTNNAQVYFLTNTIPLMEILKKISQQGTGSICVYHLAWMEFSCHSSTDFLQLILMKISLFGAISQPTYFWRSREIWKLPVKLENTGKSCAERQL